MVGRCELVLTDVQFGLGGNCKFRTKAEGGVLTAEPAAYSEVLFNMDPRDTQQQV